MLKRATSLSFLLLANMLLLAHLVISHHHHEKTGMCFLRHCQDSNEAHHHEHQDAQAHQHEGNAASDKCSLDNAYAPANNHKKIACCLPLVKCDYEQAIAYCCLVGNIVVAFKHQPLLPQFYSEFIVRSLGLRAPPSR